MKGLRSNLSVPDAINYEERYWAFQKTDDSQKLLQRIGQTLGLARPVAEHHSSVDVQGPAAIALGEFREHMRWLEQVPVLEYDEDPAAERTSSAFVEAAPLARSVGVAQTAQRDQVREVAACHLLCNVEPVNGELAKCDADVDSASVAALADEMDQSFGVYRQIVQPRALLGRARRRLPKACGPLLVRVQETWSRPTL